MFTKAVKFFNTQKNNVFCAVDSMAIALNILNVSAPVSSTYYPYGEFTQDNIFTEAALKIKTPLEVMMAPGLILKEVKAILETYPKVSATIHYTHTENTKQMAENIQTAINNGSVVLANILRT